MNGWFFVGALVGIAVTIAFEVLLAVVFDLPSRGIDDDAPSASEVVAGHTSNVRRMTSQESPRGEVIDITGRSPITRVVAFPDNRDAGHVTVGQALGVVLLTVAFLAAMAFVGAVETGGAL